MDFVNWILENGETLVQGALGLIGAGAILATITPTDKDDKIFGWLYKAIHTLGMNFGKAKNGN